MHSNSDHHINVIHPEHSPEWYDSMYNNRALVPDFAEYFTRWQNLSEHARKSTKHTREKYNDINDERDIMVGKHCGHGL